MKAATFADLGRIELQEHPKPTIVKPTDAVVRIVKTMICGTDLHILGHEGIGIVEEVGSAVNNFKVGDKVIVSCITPQKLLKMMPL